MEVPLYHLETTGSSHSDQLQAAVQLVHSGEKDLCIVTKDGHKIHTNRSLVCMYSSFVSSCLRVSQVPCCSSVAISLPVSSKAVNNLLQVLVTGVVVAEALEELSDVAQAAKILQIDLGDFDFGGKNEQNDSEDENPSNDHLSIKTEPGFFSDSDKIHSFNSDERKLKKKNKKGKRVKKIKQEPIKFNGENPSEDKLLEEDKTGIKTCHLCLKIFKDRFKLTRHMTSHSGEKPYACDQCDKSFSRLDNMKKHQRTHITDKPFSCEGCGKVFTEIHHLEKHTKSCGSPDSAGIKFSCNLCSQGFSQKKLMVQHLKDHRQLVEKSELN